MVNRCNRMVNVLFFGSGRRSKALPKTCRTKPAQPAAKAGQNQTNSATNASILSVTNVEFQPGAVFIGSTILKFDGKEHPHGPGIERRSNGTEYTGEWNAIDGCFTGWVMTPGGSRYWQVETGNTIVKIEGTVDPTRSGTWDFTTQRGHGTLVRGDGYIYKGEWRIKSETVKTNGLTTCVFKEVLDGKGVATRGKEKWRGEFRDNRLYNGVWRDADETNGMWHEKIFEQGIVIHLQGVDIWPDGSKYVGTWDDRFIENNGGTISWPDGRTYKGSWRYVKGGPDLPEGKGEMTWPDGRKYLGDFQDGKIQGSGKMTYANGKVEEGIWRDGKFVSTRSGTFTAPPPSPSEPKKGNPL